jgi:trehalose-phosphatase
LPPRLSPGSELPPLLPAGTLEKLAADEPILLCLDFDGTISEIASHPALARPAQGAIEAIRKLVRFKKRIAVAIVSGRPVADLRLKTGLGAQVMYAGVHGLEIAGPREHQDDDGDVHAGIRLIDDVARCAPELDTVRSWLARNVPGGAGFEIEDKRLSVALHYRNADAAAAMAMCARFEEFLRAETPLLQAAHNKMVVEALPVSASKGVAVRALSREAGAEFMPVYFGDDHTDEEAFAELLSRGLGVLVGARPSLARWRVDGPVDVVRLLERLAVSLP